MFKRVLIALAILAIIAGTGTWLYYSKNSPYWQGSYIPKDLQDAHSVLLRKLPKAEIERIKGFKSEIEMSTYHFGLGMWMRNNWGLWGGSRLAQYFQKLGVHHPDDMSGLILETLWCRVHDQPIRLDERVRKCEVYWKAFAEPPDTARTPEGHEIRWYQTWSRTKDNLPRAIHIGRDPIDQSFWAYEYDKGVYSPTKEMMLEIEKDDYWKTTYKNMIQRQKERESGR